MQSSHALHVCFLGVHFTLAKLQITEKLLSIVLEQLGRYFQQVDADKDREAALEHAKGRLTIQRFSQLFKRAFEGYPHRPEVLISNSEVMRIGLDNTMAIALVIKIYVEHELPRCASHELCNTVVRFW